MRLIISVLFTFAFVFTMNIYAVSRADSIGGAHKIDAAKVTADRLQQKILLSDEQASKVKDILNDYISKPAAKDGNNNTPLDKISALLDQKQKAKFDIIKGDWWNTFLKDVKKQNVK